MQRLGRAAVGLLIVVSCGGEDAGPNGVAPDELASFCDRRCEFQATCVPELREIIGECRRQCREAFDDPDLYTSNCAEPSIVVRGDPIGPYTVDSVVSYQECLITRGCGTTEDPCEETRELCLDDIGVEERCNRESRRGGEACSTAYGECIEANRPDCQNRYRQCYEEVNRRRQACSS